MKALAVICVLALSAGVAQAADPAAKPDVSGTWQVRGRIESGGVPVAGLSPVCELRQADGRISGACKGPNSEGEAVGTIVGAHLSWQWRATPRTEVGMSGAASFEGDLGADGVVRGRWSFSSLPGLSGDFTQQRP